MRPSQATIEHRLVGFRERCTALGLALTPQRLAIYQALACEDSHPSAEDLFRQLKPTLPSLSLGTVYRALELLEEHGLVVRLQGLGEQALFDAETVPHHHVVCLGCKQVHDVPASESASPVLAPDEVPGFQVIRTQVQFLGYCASCQASA